MTSSVLDRLLESHERQHSDVCRQRRETLERLMREFPMHVFDAADIPVHQQLFRSSVRLFLLGGYREIWHGHQAGKTTLYMGDDGHLYEYGPARVSVTEPQALIDDNEMSVRRVNVNELEVRELMRSAELIRLIWVG